MKILKLSEIRIRDPFFLRVNKTYYLYGTTDYNTWEGKGTGFDFYKSEDLIHFTGPYEAFRPPVDFWADINFWAPEVWKYKNAFYMIASFKKEGRCRGVQILTCPSPEGPFLPLTEEAVTPDSWECLDGTLVFEADKVYLVFCHEWLQTGDGEICAVELTGDLRYRAGEPFVLFRGSDAAWTVEHEEFGHKGYVTDGPFVMYDKTKSLHTFWSSYGEKGYAIGISHARGGLTGRWEHEEKPVLDQEGGHGMVFEAINGEKYLAIHGPNEWLKERVQLILLEKLLP